MLRVPRSEVCTTRAPVARDPRNSVELPTDAADPPSPGNAGSPAPETAAKNDPRAYPGRVRERCARVSGSGSPEAPLHAELPVDRPRGSVGPEATAQHVPRPFERDAAAGG